ncbi:MAG: FtsK/SpoIIIE domain-containing protein [Bdellovibrionota bacterium]
MASKNADWAASFEKGLGELCSLLTSIVTENYYGYRDKRIPIVPLTIYQVTFFLFVVTGFDFYLLKTLGIEFFYPTKFFVAYKLVGLFAGHIAYGAYRYFRFKRFYARVKACFQNAGLVTHAGLLPKYISNRALDNAVYEMRFFTNGIPMRKFIEAKDYLEATFFSIDDISPDPRNPHIIVIRYASTSLPTSLSFAGTPTFSDGHFPIGLGRVGWVTTSFADAPHILVGGSTGKGKSSFLRFLVTYLLVRLKNTEVWYVDLKDGTEAAVFEGSRNFRCADNVGGAIGFLKELEHIRSDRMQFLKNNKLLSIDDLKNTKQEKIKWTKAISSEARLRRIVLVVDEASSLFMSSQKTSSKDATSARSLAEIIGAKGRAAGISLVIATQRPDLRSVDTKLKAHLVGRLAFFMSDIASSNTIIDSARATQISSEHAGRAIWKEQGIYTELQLPFISSDETRREFIKANLIREEESVPEASEQEDVVLDQKDKNFDLDERSSSLPELKWEEVS